MPLLVCAHFVHNPLTLVFLPRARSRASKGSDELATPASMQMTRASPRNHAPQLNHRPRLCLVKMMRIDTTIAAIGYGRFCHRRFSFGRRRIGKGKSFTSRSWRRASRVSDPRRHALDLALIHRATNTPGRRWVFEAIEQWCADQAGEPAMLVRGGPGTGKSTLIAALMKQRPSEPRVPEQLKERILHCHVRFRTPSSLHRRRRRRCRCFNSVRSPTRP